MRKQPTKDHQVMKSLFLLWPLKFDRPFVGTLTFVRVYSGVLNSGDAVYSPAKRSKERIGRMLQMHATIEVKYQK